MRKCATFFIKRGYPDSADITGKHRTQEIDLETAERISQNEESNRIPFTLTYHLQNLAVKNVILKNTQILRSDPETKHIFYRPPLISIQRDKNICNFLVRSAFTVSLTTNQELLYVHAHIAKLVPFFLTWLRSQDRIALL